jgi:hypothetical protein
MTMGDNITLSHLNAINELTGGQLKKVPMLLYGPPAAGKSILLFQLAYDFLSKGENVLFFDTEGGLKRMIELWKPKFDQRFNVQTKIVDDLTSVEPGKAIYITEARSVKGIVAMHGYDIGLEITKGQKEDSVPKINLRLNSIVENKIRKIVLNAGIKYLAYDSFSQPMKIGFVGGRTQFPARADAINLWWSGIEELMDDFELTCWCTSHQSVDPTNAWAKPHVRGGETVKYNFKIWLYIDPYRAAKDKNLRKLWIARFFNVEDWIKYVNIELTDTGYVDRGQ